MTKKQREKLISQLRQGLKEKGFEQDRWGNMKRVITNQGNLHGKTVRFKFGKTALRYELKTLFGWQRLLSGYYANLSIGENGKVQGMKR